jgi:hypothetical protein
MYAVSGDVMGIELVILYSIIAISSALVCAFLRAKFELDVFLCNVMLGGVASWTAGVLFGAVGPLVWGVPVLACVGLAMPAMLAFNGIFARDAVTSVSAEVIDLHPGEELPAARAV